MTTDLDRIVPDEMEQAFDHLQELEWSFAHLLVLHAASEAGLLRHLAEVDQATVAELSAALGLDPGATGKVLRLLAAGGLLAGEGEVFSLRPGFRPLFEEGSELDHADAVAHLVQVSQGWARDLPGYLRTGAWERRARTPELAARFSASMRSLAHGHVGRLAAAVDLAGSRHLVDLGGALGTYSLELCLRNPGLRATVVDLPEVVPGTRQEIARLGLEDRAGVLAGSYHDVALPADVDAVLLANVLHQESREAAARLIRRAADAVLPGGQVIVVDFILEASRRAPWLGAAFAINMRGFGDAWTPEDYQAWMEAAGLTGVERHDLSRHKLAVVGHRPRT